MMTLQNLDVHGTFGVHKVSLKNTIYINALAINIFLFTALSVAGSSDELDRYRSDLQSKSPPENAQAPIVEGLFISGGPSAASHMPAIRLEEPQ